MRKEVKKAVKESLQEILSIIHNIDVMLEGSAVCDELIGNVLKSAKMFKVKIK